MCGICGIVVPESSHRRVDGATIARMRDTMVHRGPDGAGLFVEPGIGLGHRRLSIVDVAAGAQPMASDDGRLQIVYNGEVYNHPSIMSELQADGVHYHTRCDTESVLHLYERYGVGAASRLRGMFAFAIWDRSRRELALVRDRLGVKPLYYALTDDGALYFASEIKAIVEAGGVRAALNRRMLPELLANRAPMGEETLFEGVRRLPPGHTLIWRDGHIRIEPYWDLHFEPTASDRPDAEWVEEFSHRFRESVRLRLMADVPLGMFLSGGIDSAAITAVMSELVDEPIKTFSVAFAEREANELTYARMVAEKFRTNHHEIVVSPDEFFGALPKLLWHEDEPIAHPSSVPLNFVSRLAAQHVKVVLTGEGSDENLAGYPWYRATVINAGWGARYESMMPGAARRLVRSAIDALPAKASFPRKLRRTFLYLPADLDTLVYDNFGVYSRAWQRQLLSADLAAELGDIDPYAPMHARLATTDAKSLLNRLLSADIKTYLHELLMKQDQMSMAASIESRVPFLDHTLMEFLATMPERMKLRGLTTKYVLRRAMTGVLPAPILSRKKMGFPVPMGAWLRGPYAAWVEEYALGERALGRGLFRPDTVRRIWHEHKNGLANHGERLWSLINLELWHRTFVEGEASESLGVGRARTHAAVA